MSRFLLVIAVFGALVLLFLVFYRWVVPTILDLLGKIERAAPSREVRRRAARVEQPPPAIGIVPYQTGRPARDDAPPTETASQRKRRLLDDPIFNDLADD